jgi:hypothetical protein
VDELGKLWYEDRICVPQDEALQKLILEEAHHSAYSIHPGSRCIWTSNKNIGGPK